MNDPPTLGEFTEDESEQSAGARTVRHRESPTPASQGRVRSEQDHLHTGKREPAHLAAPVLVAGPVSFPHRLEAVVAGVAGLEDDPGCVPVPLQEAVEVLAVPVVDLPVEEP